MFSMVELVGIDVLYITIGPMVAEIMDLKVILQDGTNLMVVHL